MMARPTFILEPMCVREMCVWGEGGVIGTLCEWKKVLHKVFQKIYTVKTVMAT